MIYWKSVWAHSHRDTSSLLARHSSAEMAAYERRLRPLPPAAAPGRRASVVRLDGTPWTPKPPGRPRPDIDLAKPGRLC